MNLFKCSIISFFILFSFYCAAGELSFKVLPYIQETTATGLKIRWERALEDGAKVRVGKLNSDNEIEFNAELLFRERFRIHRKKTGIYESKIEGLLPNTSYYYQIILADNQSSIYNFKTLNDEKEDFSFLILADAQHGQEITSKIVQESVIYRTFSNNPDKAVFPPRFSLFPGDLVQHGILKHEWKKQFFTPMAPLLHRLAIYPVRGNHEMGSYFFNKYFSLPRSTSSDPKLNYYFFDYSNVRFINLDTNLKFRNKKQINWLKIAMREAINNQAIDFIVLQFHHPFKSEAWPFGNTDFTGQIEDTINEMANETDKPIIYFNGHTHAYSRGHHPKNRLTMITVGPIGGAIDKWNRRSKDYIDYQKTIEQYGWAMTKVKATGGKPSLEIIRYGFGDENDLQDKGINDRYKINRYSNRPEKPSIIHSILDKDILTIHGTPYEGDETHLSTEVKLIKSTKRGRPQEESFYFHQHNIFNGKEHNKHKELTLVELPSKIGKNEDIKIKIRYRNNSLVWSEWSEEFQQLKN